MAKKIPAKKTRDEVAVKMKASLTQVLSDKPDTTANAVMGGMQSTSPNDDEVVHTKAPINIVSTQIVERNIIVPTVSGSTQFQTQVADGTIMPTVTGQRASVGIPTVSTQGVTIPRYPINSDNK